MNLKTVEDVLSLIEIAAPLIPDRSISFSILAATKLARSLEQSGLFDTAAPVDIAQIGVMEAAAFSRLQAELAKTP